MVKAKTLQILWHEKQPIYSLDFEHNERNRLGIILKTVNTSHLPVIATCGADHAIRVPTQFHFILIFYL